MMANDDREQSDNFFDMAYQGTAPWDIGGPQPALIELLDEIEPLAPILDVGAGTGYLSLWLAEKGFSVIGIDNSEAAIAQAQAKLEKSDASISQLVEFRVGDALHPSLIPEAVKSVVDSGFIHVFGPDERRVFAQELTDKLPPGGRYYLLGFAFQSSVPNAPRKVSPDELRELFSVERGWQILILRQAQFQTVGGNVPAIACCVERN